MDSIEQLTRACVRKLKPYSSARGEHAGQQGILLDANENPFENGYNRYPDPLQKAVKAKLSAIKGVPASQMFLGNGSDEAIDLLFRGFCEPRIDKVLICPPTYGMYEVSAGINDVELIRVPLLADFSVNLEAVLEVLQRDRPKLTFICSPNNPTANLIDEETIASSAEASSGLVVVDEAYIDFAPEGTVVPLLAQYPNLVVLQTLSKAWGLAGIRLGIALANEAVIAVFNKIKPPYNVNLLTQQVALKALDDRIGTEERVQTLIQERMQLADWLEKQHFVRKVWPSDANFLLVEFDDPHHFYHGLSDRGILIRDRSSVVPGCLRISIGTPEENAALVIALRELEISNEK
ncbi:MAG: histidinol-phosphate transaminase [Bacteroidetes bacterium]|nr:histidinol-phosphate transaminase [Bacteroidota bacterium]